MGIDSIEKRFGIDYESPEWKAGVISYNNRVLLKYDIESRKFLRLKRLLREGNISILDKDNQCLLADFIDYAISNIPKEKNRRGRPYDDEIKKIELQQYLNNEYKRLRSEGITIDETLKYLSEKTSDFGKALGVKRVDQLCREYRENEDNYINRLYQLYMDFGAELNALYNILVGDEVFIDYMSCLSDCKIEDLNGIFEEMDDDRNFNKDAIGKLADQLRLSESDVEKRLSWYFEHCE